MGRNTKSCSRARGTETLLAVARSTTVMEPFFFTNSAICLATSASENCAIWHKYRIKYVSNQIVQLARHYQIYGI